MHYGTKGMKWGVRNYRNFDGTLTAEGRARYGVGTGRAGGGSAYAGGARARVRSAGSSSVSSSKKPALTPQQIEARKAKTRKILKIAGGIALASLAAYGAVKGYKKSTELRDKMRQEVLNTVNTEHKNIHTLNSKYWFNDDRKEFHTRSVQRANDMANQIRRRDALAAKFAEKTGIRINMHRSRKEVLDYRHKENEDANFIRKAESRASVNRQIHDARKDLKDQIASRNQYANMQKYGTSKQYVQAWLPIVAAAQLIKGKPEEKDLLMKWIDVVDYS